MLRRYFRHRLLVALALPVWVLIGFYAAQFALEILVYLLVWLRLPLASINESLLNSIFAVVLYGLAIAIVVVLPIKYRKVLTSWSDLGFKRLPSWSDIVITPAGFVVYFISSSLLLMIGTSLLPWIDINQVQQTGFNHIGHNYELILAFLTLVVLAPVAEETLFRGYLYGKLKKSVPVWAAVVITSLVFAFVHGAWNLALDTFALSVVLCLLREMTDGSLWASILLHMTKNSIAFYFLFII